MMITTYYACVLYYPQINFGRFKMIVFEMGKEDFFGIVS